MSLLKNVYDSLGSYLLLIGLMMLLNNISTIYLCIKYKRYNLSMTEKLKLLIKLLYIVIFVFGYLLFVLFNPDRQSLNNIIKIVCGIFLIILVKGIFCYTAYLRYHKQIKSQDVYIQHYVIKSDPALLWVFVICTVITGGCEIFCFLEQAAILLRVLVFSFFILSLIGTFNMGLWKVEVNDMEIIYRSTFGRIRKYSFENITKGVYKRSGAFRVYVGEKRIFTFDNSMDFDLFLNQMRELHIPIWGYEH